MVPIATHQTSRPVWKNTTFQQHDDAKYFTGSRQPRTATVTTHAMSAFVLAAGGEDKMLTVWDCSDALTIATATNSSYNHGRDAKKSTSVSNIENDTIAYESTSTNRLFNIHTTCTCKYHYVPNYGLGY